MDGWTSNPTLIDPNTPILIQTLKQRHGLFIFTVHLWFLFRAKLSYHCKPPENHPLPAYLSDTVVAEMQKGWDLTKIKLGNEDILKGTINQQQQLYII